MSNNLWQTEFDEWILMLDFGCFFINKISPNENIKYHWLTHSKKTVKSNNFQCSFLLIIWNINFDSNLKIQIIDNSFRYSIKFIDQIIHFLIWTESLLASNLLKMKIWKIQKYSKLAWIKERQNLDTWR